LAGGDFEATAKTGDKRNGDNRNGTSDKNKQFVVGGFLEIGFNFFDQFPANADVFAEFVDERFTAEIGNEENHTSANSSADSIGQRNIEKYLPNSFKKRQAVGD